MFFKPDLDQPGTCFNFPTFSPPKQANPWPHSITLPHTTPTSGLHCHCVSWGRIHLCLQVDVQATSQSFISKAQVVSRAGSLCGAGRQNPPREPLPGVIPGKPGTQMPFLGGSIAQSENYCASPKYFYFEPFYPWDMKWGLENLLHIGFQDLWVWTKENSHSDPYAKKKKGRHSLIWGEHKGVFKKMFE